MLSELPQIWKLSKTSAVKPEASLTKRKSNKVVPCTIPEENLIFQPKLQPNNCCRGISLQTHGNVSPGCCLSFLNALNPPWYWTARHSGTHLLFPNSCSSAGAFFFPLSVDPDSSRTQINQVSPTVFVAFHLSGNENLWWTLRKSKPCSGAG